jgi:hypothetical protein
MHILSIEFKTIIYFKLKRNLTSAANHNKVFFTMLFPQAPAEIITEAAQ